MQVLLSTAPHIDGCEAVHEHLELVVLEVLGQFGERIARVQAHLTSENGTTQIGLDGVHCTLEARLVNHEPVVAKHHASTAKQAIHGALRKLSCVLASEFEKQEHRYASSGWANLESAQTPSEPCCCSPAPVTSIGQP